MNAPTTDAERAGALEARVAELEADNASLRAELGRADDDHEISLLMRDLSVNRTEARILLIMAGAGDTPVSRYTMIDRLGWSDRAAKHIDVFICKLRKRVGRDAVVTVRGVGFLLKGDLAERLSSVSVATGQPESSSSPRLRKG